MNLYGLIGRGISYSFSKKYFTDKFEKESIADSEYVNFDLENLDSIKEVFTNEKVKGLNVTIPYKQEIIPYLDSLDDEARKVNAVNTISFENGKTVGYNTDIIGFRNSIKPFFEPQHSRALILGTGGASQAIASVLTELGVSFFFVSRNPKSSNEISYSDLSSEAIANYPFIINCTPLGTHPNVDGKPDIPYEGISDKHLLYDLVYNPSTTAFMKEGLTKGAVVVNGLSMLQQQAEAAWKIWNKI